MNPNLRAAAFGLAVLLTARASAAEPSSCSAEVSRSTVVGCALARSPRLVARVANAEAATGRLLSGRPLLPSNPALSGGLAARSNATASTVNWNVGISQELEISGQRGLRVDALEAERSGAGHRVRAARVTIAADAWSAYFRGVAGSDRLALAVQLEAALRAVAETARGMANAGVASEVDADIADAAALRASQTRILAQADADAALLRLQTLTGARTVIGPLDPLPPPTHTADVPDLGAAQDEARAAATRITLARRMRVPNPTVALQAQSDGFDERVFGAALSIPIPLPSPVGHSQQGEVEEAIGLARAAEAEQRSVEVAQEEELALAQIDHAARSRVRALFSADRNGRARARLEGIAAQVKAARVPVRDAVVAQQALVDQLFAELDARESLCLASVRLRVAAGQPLEGAL